MLSPQQAFSIFLLLVFLSFEPTHSLFGLKDSSKILQENIRESVTIQITIRALLVSIYFGLIKRKKKYQLTSQSIKLEQPLAIIVITILLSTSMNSYFFMTKLKNTQQISAKFFEWNCQKVVQESILSSGLIILMNNKFKLSKSRQRLFYLPQVGYYMILLFLIPDLDRYSILISEILLVLQFELRKQKLQVIQIENQDDVQSIEEINELKDIEEEDENSSIKATDSRANELLQKLRLLKYQLLIKQRKQAIKQEINQQQNIKNNIKPPSSTRDINRDQEEKELFKGRGQVRQNTLTQQMELDKLEKEFSQSRPSISKQDPESQLESEEIDDLIKFLSGRKEQIWLPNFLRSRQYITEKKNNFSDEAKKFLIGHFTESNLSGDSKKNSQLLQQQLNQPNQNQEIIEGLQDSYKNYSFDFFSVFEQEDIQKQAFMDHCSLIFAKYDIQNVLSIKNFKVCLEFCRRIELCYNQNPYHNSIHAIDVVNSSAFFIEYGFGDHITKFEQSCLIVSSLAHDVGHPGFNNGFMVTSNSKQALLCNTNIIKLVLLVNDQSVLENFHSALLFHIMQNDSCNLTKELSCQMQKIFRKYCITLILDTDLQKHFLLLNRFKNYLALDDKNFKEESNRQLVMSMCIKAADVGHGAKELRLHKLWSRRIIEEFFIQGDLEQSINIPVTPSCDRNLSITKSQEGFLKAIVLPLFESFNEFLQSKQIQEVCINQINENIHYWQAQQKEEEQNNQTSFIEDTQEVLKWIQSNSQTKQDAINVLFSQ